MFKFLEKYILRNWFLLKRIALFCEGVHLQPKFAHFGYQIHLKQIFDHKFQHSLFFQNIFQ